MYAALASQLRAGDHIVASRALFGSCLQVITNLLPRHGITYTLVDGTDLSAWEAAVKPQTRVFFCETPANPTLELVDIAAVGAIARAAGVCFVVDNAFASPAVQRAAPQGADVVTYSATKHIDGQGRCLGGAICCSEAFYEEHLQFFVRHTGPSLSPFNAWTLAKSLETLDLRVSQMARNAAAIASFLETYPGVERVSYPGLPSHPQNDLAGRQMNSGGTLVAFQVKGGQPAAFRAINALNLIRISDNLGQQVHGDPPGHDHTSRAQRRGTLVGRHHQQSGAVERGLELDEDLIADLDQALNRAQLEVEGLRSPGNTKYLR